MMAKTKKKPPTKIEHYQCNGCQKLFVEFSRWAGGMDDPLSPCCRDHFTDQAAVDAGRSCSNACCGMSEEEVEAYIRADEAKEGASDAQTS